MIVTGRCSYAENFKAESHEHVMCECPNCPEEYWSQSDRAVFQCSMTGVYVKRFEIEEN